MMGITATTLAGARQGREFRGRRPDTWDRVEMRSLTSGLADVWGPFGGDGGEGIVHRPTSWRIGLDGAVVLGQRGEKWAVKIFQF
jgi:hypothetical protein